MKANRTRIHALLFSFSVVLSGCGDAVQPIEPSRIDQVGDTRARSGFNEVTRDHGELVVNEGEFEFESDIRPWSSWWYPIKDNYLFESGGNGSSPLEKFDRYVSSSHSLVSQAARFERENIFDPNAGNWEGLCNAWAAASILAPEPVHPITLSGVTFGVGDLKALLVKTYEFVPGLKQYGQRYNGDRTSHYDDIYPDQFHRLVQAELFEKGRPFIMDKDPGVAVWNTPVWRVQMHIVADSTDRNVMHVTSWLFGASPFVKSYDFVGTLSVVFQYSYDLHGYPQPDGSFLVKYGEWTHDSVDDHPDFLIALPSPEEDARIARGSGNRELTATLVDEIFSGGPKGEAFHGLDIPSFSP